MRVILKRRSNNQEMAICNAILQERENRLRRVGDDSVCFNPGRDRDQDRNRDSDRMTRLEPGAVIPVRTNEAIEVERRDNRVYTGTVDQDVRGSNGRVAIPRGANVELMVRVERDNDLILDLESVVVNGQR